MAVSGSRCPQCSSGQLRIRTSKPTGDWQTRYLQCTKCGHQDRQVVRADMIHRREGR